MTGHEQETVEDLTALDSLELHERIDTARTVLADRAISVCWTLQAGSDPADRLAQFTAAEAALAVLYAENSRRIEVKKAAGIWPFPDQQAAS